MGFEMKLPDTWDTEQTVHVAMMEGLLGGAPEAVPDAYRLFSPVEHVGPHCPPTLLLQGEHDPITSADAVRQMAQALRNAGVPAVYVEYPRTEHAFDLILPQVSPPAQAALYEVDRFLARLARGLGQGG
jgi:acetyl esterase/lipase